MLKFIRFPYYFNHLIIKKVQGGVGNKELHLDRSTLQNYLHYASNITQRRRLRTKGERGPINIDC